ncbi:CaiB/BaiF CoA transferase family protein [Acuticoccus kandeliae]|uniref:CaiB/BaiF CoA transferase family protein n=1 Tax=Acuticoccus kandeliae TaxID=2073160 RepID=UPI000D3ED0F4|nr:CaiB/BaiF CoA-transferase family protein [Acuticoccus kandeliae]
MAGPLQGLRVVEFDAIGPVPLCAMLFGDLGADIVRIARPGGQAAYAEAGNRILHRSRPSAPLDLKTAEGRSAALALVEKADVLLEGFRPGVMERLGLGPDVALAANQRLVYGRMTGWGQTGPLADRAGHDINYISLTGALSAVGEKDGPPLPPLNLFGDYAGGAMFLAYGVLAAVISARATGTGQVVDAAMIDGVPLLLSLFLALADAGEWGEERGTNLLDGGAPFYRCYRCADGRYVAVGAMEPKFFAALIGGLGICPESVNQHDRCAWPALAQRIGERFLTRSVAEWAEHFAGTDACVTPVLTMAEAPTHPQSRARGAYVPLGDGDGCPQPAPAPRFSATHAAPTETGATTAEAVLARWSAAAATARG